MSMPTVVVEAAFGVPPRHAPAGLYLSLPGTSGNFASTPDSASLDITGDIDLRVVVGVDDWFQSGPLIQKRASGQVSYEFALNPAGFLLLALSGDGSIETQHTSDVSLEDSVSSFDRRGLRVTWRASDGRVQFFTSDDDGATWDQLGSNRTLDTIASIHAGTADLTVGGSGLLRFEGHVYSAEVFDGIDGTLVASPDFTDRNEWSVGATSGSDAAGNTWTINQSGDPEAVIVDEWTDLTSRVGYPGGISWRYGRNNERESADAGTGSIVFDNADRALDPTNEASPYWPFVRPMTRIRVRATHLTVTYPVLEAFVESWPPQWAGDHHAFVTCKLVDGFKLLSMARTSVGYSQALSGTRIGELLDAADWSTEKRTLDAGQSQVQAYTASDRIVLNAIRDTAEAESGVFFIDPSGDATFRDRLSRVVNESQATFDETSTTLPYENLQLSHDDSELWNDIAVKPEGLTVQRAEDEVSQATYGHRQPSEFGALVTTELEASDLAHWTLRRYKDPRLRVDAVDLAGDLFEAVMTQILARGIGHRVTVVGVPPGGGAQISEEVFIEHVRHEIGATSWRTTWQLSPAFSESVWLAGLAGFSEAGETTFAGY